MGQMAVLFLYISEKIRLEVCQADDSHEILSLIQTKSVLDLTLICYKFA